MFATDVDHWKWIRLEEAAMNRKCIRPPSEFALHIWTLVARRGMTPAIVARQLETSARRVERIVVGVSKRNAHRWS